MSEDANFLSRWARRKAEVQESEAAQATAEQKTAEGGQPEELDDRDRPVTEEEIAALPDPDSLEHGADFKPFLRPGIPQALRQRALRRIWRVNPAIGFLDGMNEYDLDYTDAATVVDNLKTAYQVGRGFVVPEEEEAPAETADAAENEAAEGEVPEPPDPDLGPEAEGESPEAVSTGAVEAAAVEAAVERVDATKPCEAKTQDDEMQHERSRRLELQTPAPSPGRAAARRWQRFST